MMQIFAQKHFTQHLNRCDTTLPEGGPGSGRRDCTAPSQIAVASPSRCSGVVSHKRPETPPTAEGDVITIHMHFGSFGVINRGSFVYEAFSKCAFFFTEAIIATCIETQFWYVCRHGVNR